MAAISNALPEDAWAVTPSKKSERWRAMPIEGDTESLTIDRFGLTHGRERLHRIFVYYNPFATNINRFLTYPKRV